MLRNILKNYCTSLQTKEYYIYFINKQDFSDFNVVSHVYLLLSKKTPSLETYFINATNRNTKIITTTKSHLSKFPFLIHYKLNKKRE